MSGSMLILLTMIGQAAGPGPAPGPVPRPAVASEAEGPAKSWLDGQSPVDGKPCKILGWMEGGYLRFWPADNPHLYPGGQPRPTPEPATPISPATPAHRAPTGVIADKLPHIQAGQSWYGGNAPGPVGAPDGRPTVTKPQVHLTVIGPERDRERVMRDLKSDPALAAAVGGLGDRLAIQDYEPDDPMVARVNLPDGGRPDIVIQDATGKELHREHAYGGPKLLAAEIRKADPTYRPSRRDADPEANLDYLWMGAGILALLAIIARIGNPQKASTP